MKKIKWNPEIDDEEHYAGNIWGWKVSLFSLAVILILVGMLWFQKCQRDMMIESPHNTVTETIGD